jgi:hypothetical protein
MPMPPLPDALSRAATGPIYIILTRLPDEDGTERTDAVATADRSEAETMLRLLDAVAPSRRLVAGLDQATVDITTILLRPHHKPATPNGDPA